MASKKKKKQAIRSRRPQVKKKENPEKKLAKALTDLTKIFPRKKLARQFRITPRQVSTYKNFRKRKPLSAKKRNAILRFYKKLQAANHYEDLRYSYRVSGPGRRLAPVKWIPTAEVNDLIRKKGVKGTAKLLHVNQDTVLRWKSGKFQRIEPKNRERLYRARRKSIRASFDGIFLLLREWRREGERRLYSYPYILFYDRLKMTRDEALVYVQNDNRYRIKDSVIERRFEFSESSVARFTDHLTEIKRHGNPELTAQSTDSLRRFIDTEFKGRPRERLNERIETALNRRKRRRFSTPRSSYPGTSPA